MYDVNVLISFSIFQFSTARITLDDITQRNNKLTKDVKIFLTFAWMLFFGISLNSLVGSHAKSTLFSGKNRKKSLHFMQISDYSHET